jgi:hypothetical protein
VIKLTPRLKAVFPEPPEAFPVKPWKATRLISGRTLVRTGSLHTAVLLIEGRSGIRLRLNTFSRHKDGTWGSPQWLIVTPTVADRLLDSLDLFVEAIAPVRKRRGKV